MKIMKRLLKTYKFNDGDMVRRGRYVYMISDVKPWCKPPTVDVFVPEGGREGFAFPCLLSDLEDVEGR